MGDKGSILPLVVVVVVGGGLVEPGVLSLAQGEVLQQRLNPVARLSVALTPQLVLPLLLGPVCARGTLTA